MFKSILSIIILIVITVFSSLHAQHKISNLFRKFRNDEGVQHFNLSGDVTKMLQGKDHPLKSKVDEMHVYLFSKNQDIGPTDQKKIEQSLRTEKFEMLVKTTYKDGQVILHGKEANGFLTQVYAEINLNGSAVYLILYGKILLGELSKMNFNFEGSKALKSIPAP